MSKETDRISQLSIGDILFELIKYSSYWIEERNTDEDISDLVRAYIDRLSNFKTGEANFDTILTSLKDILTDRFKHIYG